MISQLKDILYAKALKEDQEQYKAEYGYQKKLYKSN